jgi:hypothetical protein
MKKQKQFFANIDQVVYVMLLAILYAQFSAMFFELTQVVSLDEDKKKTRSLHNISFSIQGGDNTIEQCSYTNDRTLVTQTLQLKRTVFTASFCTKRSVFETYRQRVNDTI